MLMNQDLAAHLARDHERQLLAEASHERRYRDRPAPRVPSAATRVREPAGSRLMLLIRRSRAA